MLAEHGEFFPYACGVALNGETAMVAGDPGTGEQPESGDVLATLTEKFSTEREAWRAVAIVADVRLADSDAIRVELEHSEGPVMAVLLPYKRSRLRRSLDYGDLVATTSSRRIWVSA
jgi:hypothetical protein